jgi:hypothetical protein
LDTSDQPSQDDVTKHWRGVLHEPLVINAGWPSMLAPANYLPHPNQEAVK